jgi:glutamate--cysteine ligase catalytic subunit
MVAYKVSLLFSPLDITSQLSSFQEVVMGKQLEGEYLPADSVCTEVSKNVQERAVDQLVRLWRGGNAKSGRLQLWGDEIEYTLVRLDQRSHEATLSLRQSTVLQKLSDIDGREAEFSTEFARYMVEGMPHQPYGEQLEDMATIEDSMRARQALAHKPDQNHANLC